MANTDTNKNSNVYEIGYLLAPTIPEDKVDSVEADLLESITKAGGEIVASQSPEMRELSYEIEVKEEGEKRQFARGQFGWVQFSTGGEKVDAAEEAFIDSNDVIRHLLISVDPEAVGKKGEDDAVEKEA